MKHAILCIDDEPDNVDALERLFRKKYQVFKSTSAAEGLEILKNQDVSVIITDQRMPSMTGVEFLQLSQKSHPDAIRILLTGYTDIESVIGAINSGQVYRYITKPWEPVDLANTVDKAVERYELGHQLKERNEQLKKAYEELQVLDQAKNQFMILINHELKTPLTVILSYLELLKDSSLDEDQVKFVGRISESSQRLQSLIQDALELVSAETGLTKPQPERTSAAQLLAGLDQSFLPSAKRKSQSIELRVADLPVLADSKIIRSVVTRILDNAVKFGDEKSPIWIEGQATPDHHVRISVINRGKALSPETIAKIMKPFSLDEDVMHHSKGTGLGLSVSQALLKIHSSQLQINCQNGEFRVSFDLASPSSGPRN